MRPLFAFATIAALAGVQSALADSGLAWEACGSAAEKVVLSRLFEPLATLILTALIAGPALASIVLLLAAARWPRLERSIWLGAISGVVVTLAMMWAVAGIANEASTLFDTVRCNYWATPYLAVAVVAIAVWLQIRARATFSRPRAAVLAGAVMTPIALVAIQVLSQ